MTGRGWEGPGGAGRGREGPGGPGGDREGPGGLEDHGPKLPWEDSGFLVSFQVGVSVPWKCACSRALLF